MEKRKKKKNGQTKIKPQKAPLKTYRGAFVSMGTGQIDTSLQKVLTFYYNHANI